MKYFIFIPLIILVMKFGMFSYKQGDRQIPTIATIIAIILLIIMLNI
jgi:hypothetical protein